MYLSYLSKSIKNGLKSTGIAKILRKSISERAKFHWIWRKKCHCLWVAAAYSTI